METYKTKIIFEMPINTDENFKIQYELEDDHGSYSVNQIIENIMEVFNMRLIKTKRI